MSNWPTAVGSIVDGVTTFSEDGLGVIINNLKDRTDWLREKVSASSDTITSRGFVFHDTGFSYDCKVGMMVAWDSGTGMYVPALAEGTKTYRSDGTEIPADTAKTLGVILSLDPETTGGTVLCYGCVSDPDVVAALLGDSPVTGDYYLSTTTPGSVYRSNYADTPMSAYCLTYLYSANDNSPTVFVRPYPPAYNGTSEVRSVTVGEDSVLLQATTDKGAVKLKISPELIESDDSKGKAITGVTRNGFSLEPVVNKVVSGPGTVITETGPGTFVISSNSVMHSVLDLNLCALDGVYLGTSDSNGTVYTFPAGVTSALTGTIRLPYLGDSHIAGELEILVEGSTSVTSLSTASVTVQSTELVEGDTINKAVPLDYAVENVSAIDPSKLYKIVIRISDTQYFTSNSLMYVKLSAVTPATATKVVSIALKLTEVIDA